MQEEFDALTVQGTWVLVPPPPNINIVGSKWIYKVKKKSRWGFSQEQGLDLDETFCPMVRHTTVKLVSALGLEISYLSNGDIFVNQAKYL
ncbi:hypothetical protein Prudu_005925 [Prunus dulcis]|uniref:Transposable element protein n=1 Tax=Prunus dulcis TaxID=3755 RepID=A0A4Y1QYN9_PRUDU|nr:hypothetical protein Prudu_005925 [Prunus dulcis]